MNNEWKLVKNFYKQTTIITSKIMNNDRDSLGGTSPFSARTITNNHVLISNMVMILGTRQLPMGASPCPWGGFID